MMRFAPAKVLKSILSGGIVVLLIVNIQLLYWSGSGPRNGRLRDTDGYNEAKSQMDILISTSTKRQVQFNKRPKSEVPMESNPLNHILDDLDHIDMTHLLNHLQGQILDTSDKEALQRTITLINRNQTILNAEKFHFQISKETVVIVVQVHNRLEYLLHLLNSLRNVPNVHRVLLVISHDYYSNEVNAIVHSINFCPVIQIFLPYTIQLYSNSFPGDDPNDCPRDIKKEEALKRKCNNAEYPDKYGHYRESKYCQIKHHWIWKAKYVFEDLRVTRNHSGLVLFLEEDHMVVDDLLVVMKQLQDMRIKRCPDCDILTLGNYDKNINYAASSARVETSLWVSSKHNMGMALTKNVWNKISSCAKDFCEFDDYNWDWTLQYVGMKCMPSPLKVLYVKSPRVYHIGECGTHAKHKICNPRDRVNQINTLLKNNEQFLFPDTLTFSLSPVPKIRLPKPNGGWGDKRDRDLCRDIIAGFKPNFTRQKIH
ncbi:unnamed protein product [Owenia fusiformis]|uniref:Alpha-1,6-mannosyl-glycoprotein 2-beta-N-acetylglucosaminyltransferase n=1 Tax=Owenia fusiformis TaxID=6347 RepID=A0A8S4NSQ9_OWEFU|nr:unnamed protein product [Owenia fusiformis]